MAPAITRRLPVRRQSTTVPGDASTATVYADLYDEYLQAVAGRLGERLSGSGVAPVLPETPGVVVPTQGKSR